MSPAVKGGASRSWLRASSPEFSLLPALEHARISRVERIPCSIDDSD
jgi:hypothetical protein